MGRKAVSFLFYGISVVLTGLLLVAAVLCRYASSVSPGEGGFWATLALLMPVVLLATMATIWLADMADFAEMNAVWDAWAPQGHTPARATGESALATPDYKVEIIVIVPVLNPHAS